LQKISPELITQTAATVLTAAILWALYIERDRAELHPPVKDPGVRISLEPPAPAPPKAEPEKPKPRVEPVRRHVVVPTPAPDLPVPTVSNSDPTPDAPAIVTAPPAPAAASLVSDVSLEAAYVAALNENIHARTTPPDTAAYRLLKPTGSTRVRFYVDRSGSPSEVTVAETSGSRILDTQALYIVSSGHYLPFPDALYRGEKRHYFTIKIKFEFGS
jgi:periplasmic protein TonB